MSRPTSRPCCRTEESNVNRGVKLFAVPVIASVLAACEPPDTSLVPPPALGWPTNGGNWYNQRYSPLTLIDRSNVANLKGVWRTRLEGSGIGPQYSGEAQPLVVGDFIYVPTG